ncbi:PAS domain S-box protein [Halococcus sp. IIIV-5B]|uniref:PAS domain S-box protein n=1 Tax=Halococcus sp. IIIV-5B TaxID=2321230 RepID=UPI000E769F87|nr:PAS domain S-box protein [Halococcus sp. IIIV-5B]RJT02549.1 PAS domain S-box protein [Halococcus sp. IIIV-5B]
MDEISVLWVDDERSVADLGAAHLDRLLDGVDVTTETSASAALERFERAPGAVDCIVSDYTMPGMDGLEFLAAVRDSHPAVPFILFTGKGSEEAASEAISAGVTDYLRKSTGSEQYELLANRIEHAVEADRATDRAADLARINAVVAEVQRELVRQSTREGIETRVCDCLAGSASYSQAWIATATDDDGFAVRERAGDGAAFDDRPTDDATLDDGPIGRAMRTGEPQVYHDGQDGTFESWRETVDYHEFDSVITLPLSYDEASYGVLGIYADRRAFEADERDALTELAGTIAQAIHAAETRGQLERRERALAESERKYRALLDTGPDAVLVVDAATGEVVETNAAATALLGRDRESLLGADYTAIYPEDEAERYRELFDEESFVDGKRSVGVPDGSPLVVERADGEHVPVEVGASIVELDDRRLIQGVFRDISERRARERELHEERAVIESLFDATPDPIYAFDADGRMLRWNETFESVVGYSTEEIAGMNCLEFIPPADHALLREKIEAVVERGERVTVESAFVTKAGETVPHEFSGAQIVTEEFQGAVGTGRDITDRKARERESERYRTATDAVDDAVYVLDSEGRFEFVNQGFTDLTGYEAADVLGESVEQIKDPETAEMFEELVREMLSTGAEETTVEFEIRTADGDRVACEDHLALRLADGEFRGVAGAIRDTTERRDRARTVAALHEATRDFMRAEGRPDVADATAAAVEDVLGFSLAAVRFYDPETDTLDPVALTPSGAEQHGDRPSYDRDEGFPWRAFEAEQPIVASGSAVIDTRVDVESALYVPIGDHGTLSIVSTEGDFGDADIELARMLTANAATALDRLAREEQLRRYRRMLDTAGDSIYALDTEGRFMAANDRLLDVVGYTREALIGEHISAILDGEAIEAGTDVVRRLLSHDAERDTASFEFEVQLADGSLRPCEAQVTLLRTDGEYEGSVGVIRDISEKKENERYRRKLYETTSSSGLDFDERIDRLLELGCAYLDAEVGFMTHIEDGTLRIEAARGSHEAIEAGAECPLSSVYCRRTVETDGPFAVNDAVAAGWKGDPARESFDLDSYIGGKLTVDDEVYGTFCFADPNPRDPFSSAEQGFVDLVARGASRELERRKHEHDLEALHDATRRMMTAVDRDAVAETAVATVEDVLDIPMNGVWRYEDDEEVLRPMMMSDRCHDLFDTQPTFEGTDSLAWEAYETGEPRYYDHVDDEPGVYNTETTMRSEMMLPFDEYGVLIVGSVEPGAFSDREFSLAKLLVTNAGAAMERAEREHLLRERQHELVTERDRLTALFENVTDAAVSYELVDGEPIARRVNARFERIFGYPSEEVIDENIDDYIVPAEHEAEADTFNEALIEGESLQTTVRRRTADGVRDFLLHIVPLEPDTRNLAGYSLYTDITEQKRHERELERQNELLDEFASVISHDLRSPMSVARGRVELAEAEASSDHHEDALWALDRMDTLIEDVLTLARQGKVIGETEPVAFEDVAERAWRTAGTETASLTVEALDTVEADPDRLTRLFENLFRNALDHAGEEASVVVGALENGFYVADDGPGIPEGEHEKIFEHGYSTTESGTGLGLMIVRNIAEAHGWDVRAVDGTDGARFEVTT